MDCSKPRGSPPEEAELTSECETLQANPQQDLKRVLVERTGKESAMDGQLLNARENGRLHRMSWGLEERESRQGRKKE